MQLEIKKYLERRKEKRRAYRRMFFDDRGMLKPDAEIILEDLRKFCYASQSMAKVSPISRSIDPYAMALAVGRNEVWQRLMKYLHLTEDTFLKTMEVITDE